MADVKRRSIDPANFFLTASLLVGILYSIFIPYGAGFDEERHLIRIYYLSQNHLLPNFPNSTLYDDVIEFSYQRRLVQSPASDLFDSANFWRRFSGLEKDIRYGVKTQSIYSPVIFLPQTLIGKILWWRLNFAILPTIILMKIAGLLIYVAGGYMAIRVLPYGKWIFAALALLPAAMYQASTLNADGFTAGVSFAFIGWVMYMYVKESSGIRPRSVWILVLLAMLLGFAKPGAIILLLLLLILFKHPFPSKKWIVLLGAGILLSIFLNVGWWMVASQDTVFSGSGVQSISNQSGQILSNPVGFIKLLVQSMVLTLPSQIQGWMAAYGYWAGKVPGPVYFFSALFLLAALLAEPQLVNIPTRTRLFFAGLFLLSCTAIYAIAFAPNYVTGGVLALVKHGRYYIPFAPLFFLGITGLFVLREHLQYLARLAAIVSFVLTVGWFSFGIYTTYYTYCGYDSYRGGKCTLPIYKNIEKEDTTDVPVHDGVQVSQTFTKFCGDLEAVQVFVKAVPENPQGSLRFSLFDGNQKLLASQDFPSSSLLPGEYLELPVTLRSDTTEYEIQLESNVPSQASIVGALTTLNYYPGRFTMNGVTARGDLIIHYICTGP